MDASPVYDGVFWLDGDVDASLDDDEDALLDGDGDASLDGDGDVLLGFVLELWLVCDEDASLVYDEVF